MTNWSSLPSLSALRAFSAYAQFGSVTEAGKSLNVSHAAISQQLRGLETQLGVPLFDRSNRSLELTPEGRELARALEDGFSRISSGVQALSLAEAQRPINVGCTPTFASAWLMPRLASFQTEHPGIDMVLSPSPYLIDPVPGGIDVAIRYGTGGWKGLDSTHLVAAPVVVVGAPTLFEGKLPKTPGDLVQYPWLEELGTNETSSWLAAQGLERRQVLSRTQVPGNLMVDGARNGQGIAVTTRIAVAEDIEAGRLIAVFEERRDAGYHMVTKPGVQRPPLKAFLKWLRREAAKT